MRRARRILLGVLLPTCLAATALTPGAAAESGAAAGSVKFVKRTDPSFDRFTEAPAPAFKAWMNQHFWRTEVVSPYFDSRTSWYRHAWLYKDLYGVYRGSQSAAEHPTWILRDGSGNPLYIPWGCSGGSCPQYAGDVGNPAFRQNWIAEAKAAAARGYAGVWIDDVNLVFRIGDGSGNQVAPIDPRTGRTMTETAWQNYVVAFLQEVRQALPGVELLHNSIWFAGGPQRWNNPLVKLEIAAADYINLERGVNDAGLTGGSGEWSLQALLSFIDAVHTGGRGVVLDGGDASPTGREYSLASYFLVSTGNDGVGLGSMTPENWWSAYNLELGTPLAPRALWQGLIRRDFTGGMVLVNGPGAPARTVTLPAPMLTTEGSLVTSIVLGSSSGSVLRYNGAPPLGGSPSVSGSSAGEALSGAYGRAAQAGFASPAGPGDRPRESADSRRHSRALLIVLRAHRSRRGHAVRLDGNVLRARSGRVKLVLQRLRGRHWVNAGVVVVPLRRAGAFAASIRHLRAGRYRVRAIYLAWPRAHASASAHIAFRLRR